jgi:hypothetical protein
MAGVTLFQVPKTFEAVYYPEAKAVVSVWESLSSPECTSAIARGLSECKRIGARSWLVDLTHNPGVASQTDLHWMATTGVDLCKKYGVQAVINIHGESSLASLGSKRWTKSASDGGLVTYDTKTLADALELAKDVAEAGAD